MTADQKSEALTVLREVEGERCSCGGAKKPYEPCCVTCWMSLPLEMKSDLHANSLTGYVEAWRRAQAWLEVGRNLQPKTAIVGAN
jgi:hypothetical protein